MDQFASIFGREGNALLIDCQSLERRYVPLELKDASVVVCDTGVRHDLAASEYNLRRAECDQAVAILRSHRPSIKSLRDATEADVEELSPYLSPLLRDRSLHVVSENRRVQEAVNELAAGNLDQVGDLMFESHASLRDRYEVSAPELDLLVEIGRHTAGVYGSRMTGGGFGGCTVNIVDTSAMDSFKARASSEYNKVFGFEPQIYDVRASDGAGEI
jgi:galactokinase